MTGQREQYLSDETGRVFMELRVATKQREYPIIIEKGVLRRTGTLIPDEGKLFIITDSGVPEIWKEELLEALGYPDMFLFRQGEASKCMRTYEEILRWLVHRKASRKDTIIALGGGVVGDLAGFAAATYMRGIRYINIPTTALSQIDSGIGGKTAIDLDGIKNTVGVFWQPSMVIIDPETLETLPERQLVAGLAEAVKAGLIRDRVLFEIFESDDYLSRIDEILYRSLMVKKKIVEEDENESSVRKLLNFGHTIGHAYESLYDGKYLHGECVAMGMMKILDDETVRSRLGSVLDRLGLPRECEADPDRMTELIMNDKKAAGTAVDIVQVSSIGDGYIETRSIDDIRRIIE